MKLSTLEETVSNSRRAANSPPFTAREVEIYRLVLLGKSNKEIAMALQISVRTVRFHMSNILKKLRVQNRMEILVALLQAAKPGLFKSSA